MKPITSKKSAAPALKVNGVPIIEALANKSRVTQLLAFLNTSPDGEVFDAPTVAAELSMPYGSLMQLKGAHHARELSGYCITVGRTLYLGKPSSIARFTAAVTAATQEKHK